jgi:hypothetical protein
MGKIHNICKEKWSNLYNLPIHTSICDIKREMKVSIPSRAYLEGYNAFIMHDGQQQSDYYCNEITQIRQNCLG